MVWYNVGMITQRQALKTMSTNLRRILVERGMTQGDLARSLHTGGTLHSWRMKVSRWCAGDTKPTPADIVNICAAIGVSVDSFLSEKK
jgi:transcriptional regulator with XRE-family HTH domain